MKRLLLLISFISLLLSCDGGNPPLEAQAVYQCNNHSLVISVYGNYCKGRAAMLYVYKDANKNKQFDEDDRKERHSRLVMLRSEEPQLLDPIELGEAWEDRYLFIVLRAGDDSVVNTIPICKVAKTELE